MTFATSLLAFSLNALKSQPKRHAHVGIQTAFSNFFAAMGGLVANSIPNKYGEADMLVSFKDFDVLVEVKSHESASGMAFYSTANKSYYPTHYSAIKQVLAYCAGSTFTRPTICMVVSNLEFMAFNPNKFNLAAMEKNITRAPCMYDGVASRWVRKQKAFKAIGIHTVASLSDYTPNQFVDLLRDLAGLEAVAA